MQDYQSQAEEILTSEMINAGVEIETNGREGVDFIVKSESGKQSEIF